MYRFVLLTIAAVAINSPRAALGAEKIMPADARYTCPMEEHPDETDPARQGPYFSAEPGKCPWCGMRLKPIEAFEWTASYRRADTGTAPASTRPAAATAPAAATTTAPASASNGGIPRGATFACPMDTHPDETDPARQGAYFSDGPGECPWCGMRLKPIEQLGWAKARLAAQGGEVGWTCPDHQHVLRRSEGECPRCNKPLQPFKVMYTCPDPKHANVIQLQPGHCPRDHQALVAFRGVWLSDAMAAANVPATTQPAASAAYRCPVHPLVHSDAPGACTICARPLEAAAGPPAAQAAATRPSAAAAFICPMHPQNVRSDTAGTCPVCAMQLVSASQFRQPTSAPDRVQRELEHVTEHYLAIARLLASDSTVDLARHALGVTAATEEMLKHARDMGAKAGPVEAAARKMHEAALKITGTRITDDRVQLVALSEGMVSLLEHLRPDRQRWPHLYVYHCPMSKGDWVQTTREKANPYYGFQMLKCGELKATK